MSLDHIIKSMQLPSPPPPPNSGEAPLCMQPKYTLDVDLQLAHTSPSIGYRLSGK